MTKRINKKLIACGLITILVTVILLSALLLLLPNSNTNAVEGFKNIGQVLDVKTDDGKVDEIITTPESDWVAISTEAELNAFMSNNTTGGNYGYLTQDIAINRSADNYGLNGNGFAKDRTLDGNGYKITITNNGANDAQPLFGNMNYGSDAITQHWYYDGTNPQSSVKELGGFIGVNWGTIKNVTFEYNIVNNAVYKTPGSAAKMAHYIGVIAGINMGYFSNTRLNIKGKAFSFNRDSADNNGGNNNMAVVGGLAALNMGEIEGITVEIGQSVTLQANSKTHDGYPTHAVLGGVVGKMLSYSGTEAYNYIKMATLKDVTMLGSGTFTILGEGGNPGYNSVLNEVGIVVGSNTVAHADKFRDSGVMFDNGVIDGVLMANTATVTSKNGVYGSQGNHTSGSAQYPVLDCGKVSNVFYAYNYTNRVTNCAFNASSHATHAAQKYSVVSLRYAPEIDTTHFDINVGIDRAKNSESGVNGNFNITFDVKTKANAPAEYIVYKLNSEKYTFATDGAEVLTSTTAMGGIDYRNSDGELTFWDDQAEINRKKGGGTVSEVRVNDGTETLLSKTYIDLGRSAKIAPDKDTQPIAGEDYVIDFDGNVVDFKVIIDNDKSATNRYDDSSQLTANAKLMGDERLIELSLREARMPGEYNNAKIASLKNPDYGFVDDVRCIVAPINDIQETVGEGKTMRITPVALSIANPNEADKIYQNYSYTLNTTFDNSQIEYVMYSANGGISWSRTSMNPSFPVYNVSSKIDGFDLRFRAYAAYTYYVNASDTAKIYVAVTAETAPQKLIIDVDAPAITYVDENGATIDKPNYDTQTWNPTIQTLRFKASDAVSGVNSVSVVDNGISETLTADANGIYSLEIKNSRVKTIVITDNIGNKLTETVRFKVDTLPILQVAEYFTLNGQTVTANQKITFNITQLGSDCSIHMFTKADGQDNWIEEIIELDKNNQYTLTKQGKYEYKFNAINESGQVSMDHTDTQFILTIAKAEITLTSDDILYNGKLPSEGNIVGISKEYDGTTVLEADDLKRLSWNPNSENYAVLQKLEISANYDSANVNANAKVIVTPVDPDGKYLFLGSIVYPEASITRKTLNIQINNATKVYTDANPIFTFGVLGLVTGESFDYDLKFKTDALDDSGVGEYNILSVFTREEINDMLLSDNSNYIISTITNGKMTITSKILDDGNYRITNSQVGADYTGKPIEITAEYKVNDQWNPLAVRYYNSQGVLLDGAPIIVGKYYYELYIEDPNYTLSNVRREFDIHSAGVNIYIKEIAADKTEYKTTYNGEKAPISIEIDNGDTGNFTCVFRDENGKELDGQPIDAGKYTLEVRYEPTDKNFKNTYRTIDFVIEKADFSKLGIKFENVTGEYAPGVLHSLKVAFPDIEYVTNNTKVVYIDAKGDEYLNEFSAEVVGTYKITARISNPNFEAYELSAQLVIRRTLLNNVKFDNTKVTYNGEKHTMNLVGVPNDAKVVFKYNGNAEEDGVKIGDTAIGEYWISATNAGNYTITATITGANYETKIITGTLSIAKADLEYTFDGLTVDYDGEEHIIRPIVPEGITYELSPVGTVDPNDGSGVRIDNDGQYFSATKPGKYIVRLHINESNYKTVSVTKTLNIEKLSLVDAFTASGYSVTYEPGKLYTFTIKTELKDIDITVACDTDGVIGDNNTPLTYNLPGAGTYRFTIYASKENYNDYVTTSTVNIYEAEMPIQFKGNNVHTYDGTEVKVSLLGLPTGAEVTWEGMQGITIDKKTNTFSVTNSGSYTVTAKVTAPNYKAKSISHTITIYDALMPSEMTGSINNKSFVYDGIGKEFEVLGAPNGANITVDITDSKGNIIQPITGTQKYLINLPETYTINVKVTADNYQDYSKTVIWTVKNAEIIGVTAENKSYKYDGTGKSVELLGVPEGATVTFKYNNIDIPTENGRYIFTRTEAGDYLVDYSVSLQYHDTITGRMRLSIVNNVFGDVNIPNMVMTYTGSALEYDITEYLEGLPEGTNVEFNLDAGVTQNGNKLFVTNVKDIYGLEGAYRVTITLTNDNYATKDVSFTITVNRKDITGVSIEDKTVTFNNSAHSLIAVAPEGATVTYTYNGVTTNSFSAVRAGKYYVTVNVSINDNNNYNDYTRTVLLDINKAVLPEFYFGAHEFQWEPEHEDFVVNVVDADGNNIDLSKYEIMWSHKNGNVFNNAGNYRLSATYKLIGFENDYEIGNVLGAEGAKAINVVVKPKKITGNIYIDSISKDYDGNAVSVDIHGVPEGATVNWTTARSYVNAGSFTVSANVSMPNYETLVVNGYVDIAALEVEVEYFIKPSYVSGETPRVVGRYTDISGEIVNFTVDTSSLRRSDDGEYEVTVRRLGDSNYAPNEASKTITVIIGTITATNNLGAIIGGSAGGAVVLGGGIAALVIILVKKKSIKL